MILINIVCGPNTKYFDCWYRGICWAFQDFDFRIDLYCPPHAEIESHDNVRIIRDFGIKEVESSDEYICPYRYWDRLIVRPTGCEVVHFSQLDWYPTQKFNNLIYSALEGNIVVPDYPDYFYIVEPDGTMVPRFWEGCCFIRSDILTKCNIELARSGFDNNHRISILGPKGELGIKFADTLKDLRIIGSGCQIADISGVFDGRQPWETLFETFLYLYLNGYKFVQHSSAQHLCGIEKPQIKSTNYCQMIDDCKANKPGYYKYQVLNILIADCINYDISPADFAGYVSRLELSDTGKLLDTLHKLMLSKWLDSVTIGEIITSIEDYA